jgi:hypothetical protein
MSIRIQFPPWRPDFIRSRIEELLAQRRLEHIAEEIVRSLQIPSSAWSPLASTYSNASTATSVISMQDLIEAARCFPGCRERKDRTDESGEPIDIEQLRSLCGRVEVAEAKFTSEGGIKR